MGIFDLFRPKKDKQAEELQQAMLKMAMVAFPGGPAQIEQETELVFRVLRGKVNRDAAKRIVTRTKGMLVIAEDKSEKRIVQSIKYSQDGRSLSPEDASLIFRCLTGISGDPYSGGDGSSQQNAIVINAATTSLGIPAEYKWIEAKYGSGMKIGV